MWFAKATSSPFSSPPFCLPTEVGDQEPFEMTTTKYISQPWQFVLIGLSGWINQGQQEAIEYPGAENQVLRELVGKKRVLLNDAGWL